MLYKVEDALVREITGQTPLSLLQSINQSINQSISQFINVLAWDEVALHIRARGSCVKRMTKIKIKYVKNIKI